MVYMYMQIMQYFLQCIKLNPDHWIKNESGTLTVKLDYSQIEQVLALMALEVMVQAFRQSENIQFLYAINFSDSLPPEVHSSKAF